MSIEYKKIKVDKCEHKDTIYNLLKHIGYSENYLKNLRKQKGYIMLNDKVVFMNEKIKVGDIIKVNKNPNTKTVVSPCIIPLDIVYEDDDIIIINKPSGLATMPSRSHYSNNLTGAIAYYKRNDPNFVVRIINRLDKDTAGLILVAKNSLVCNFFNQNPSYIRKKYFALCTGNIEKSFVINKNIATTLNDLGYNNNKRIISNTEGKPATTYVKLEKNYNNFCLVSLTLEYGRTHQIRVHMSSENHPLLGDELYGQKSSLIDHTALVCKQMTLIHPSSGKIMNFNIDFPDDFKNLME